MSGPLDILLKTESTIWLYSLSMYLLSHWVWNQVFNEMYLNCWPLSQMIRLHAELWEQYMTFSTSPVTSLATLNLLPSLNLATASQGGQPTLERLVEACKQAWPVMCLPGNSLVALASPDHRLLLDTLKLCQKWEDSKHKWRRMSCGYCWGPSLFPKLSNNWKTESQSALRVYACQTTWGRWSIQLSGFHLML